MKYYIKYKTPRFPGHPGDATIRKGSRNVSERQGEAKEIAVTCMRQMTAGLFTASAMALTPDRDSIPCRAAYLTGNSQNQVDH